jgi:hypothetical protein
MYHSTVTGFQCSAFQPLPAPAAAPLTSFNPSLPLQLDLDALLIHDASRQLLQQQLVCNGQQLPEAAWPALLQVGTQDVPSGSMTSRACVPRW